MAKKVKDEDLRNVLNQLGIIQAAGDKVEAGHIVTIVLALEKAVRNLEKIVVK